MYLLFWLGASTSTCSSLSFGYDLSGRLTGESGGDGFGISYENTWQYDAAGNRIGEQSRRASAGTPGVWTSSTSVSAVFNPNDWLTGQVRTNRDAAGATTGTSTLEWGYDANGSETAVGTVGGTPQVNVWGFDGRLLSVGTQGAASPHTLYRTDAEGNRLSVTSGIGTPNQKSASYLTDDLLPKLRPVGAVDSVAPTGQAASCEGRCEDGRCCSPHATTR